MKKWIMLVVAVFIVVIGGVYWHRQDKKKRAEEEKEEVVELVEDSVSASGSVKAENEVVLKFPTSGKLAWVGVSEGDRVEKWQALAKLDTYTLERDLKNALIAYSKQRNDFNETIEVTYEDQTTYNAVNDTVKRILEKNQWDLDKSVNDVEISHRAVELATLITPVEGIVTDIKDAVAGQNIVYTATSFTVSDPDSLHFVAEVDEIDIAKIYEGQKATITLDALMDQTLVTEVERISFTSITTSGGGTAYEVYLPLPETEGFTYRIGLNGDVEFELDT